MCMEVHRSCIEGRECRLMGREGVWRTENMYGGAEKVY